jgi:ferrous iron transport protein A
MAGEEDGMVPLGLLAEGEAGEIVSCAPRDGADGRAEDMGLRVGSRVEVLRSGPGPLLVKVEESRIALDRGIAMRIGVRKEPA